MLLINPIGLKAMTGVEEEAYIGALGCSPKSIGELIQVLLGRVGAQDHFESHALEYLPTARTSLSGIRKAEMSE